MAYRTRLTEPAEADVEIAYRYIEQHAPERAAIWLRGLFEAIATLKEMPARCPVVPEADAVGHNVRHLLYGRRPGIYRIIFQIVDRPGKAGDVVILRVWHGARDRVSADDLQPPS